MQRLQNIVRKIDDFSLYLFARPSIKTSEIPKKEDPEVPIDQDEDMPLAYSDSTMNDVVTDMDVACNIELGFAPIDDTVPLSNKKCKKSRPLNDHDYFCSVDDITEMMKELVLKEDENITLKQKLKSKQKETSKLKMKIRSLKAEVKQLKSRLQACSTGLIDPVLLELQQNKTRKLRGARYSDKMKNMAIILHYCSGKAYKQMRKYFALPSINTIKKWLSRLDVKEGFSTVILKLLKLKAAALPRDERVVTIFLDEMSVSQRITYVANAKTDYFTGFPTKVSNLKFDVKEAKKNHLI